MPLADRNAWEGEGEAGGLAVDEVPAFVLDSRPGDAVLFDFRLWHGSWKGGLDRRMFSLQVWVAQGRLSALSAFHRKIGFVWRFCMGAQGA